MFIGSMRVYTSNISSTISCFWHFYAIPLVHKKPTHHQMKKNLLILTAILSFGLLSKAGQPASETDYSVYFEKAYQQYSSIPRGVLEAVAFTNTHIQNITHDATTEESCAGLPLYYGVMGLVKDGKNYFRNNLVTVSQMSGISEQEIMSSPEKNIMAYAAAYAQTQSNFSGGGLLRNGQGEIGQIGRAHV